VAQGLLIYFRESALPVMLILPYSEALVYARLQLAAAASSSVTFTFLRYVVSVTDTMAKRFRI